MTITIKRAAIALLALSLCAPLAASDPNGKTIDAPANMVMPSAVTYDDGTGKAVTVSVANPLPVTGGGGGGSSGTEYVEDTAAPANPTGPTLICRRRDTLSTTEVSADLDWIAANCDSRGRLRVNDDGLVTALGSPFQAGGSIGNTAFGATQSGTWNITNISGTVSLPTGASTSANQSTLNTNLGATADAAWSGSGSGSLIAIGKYSAAQLSTIATAISDTSTPSPVTQSGTWNVGVTGTPNVAVSGTATIKPQDALALTFTPASSSAVLFAADTTGYNVLATQLTGTWSGTVTIQGSNDSTNGTDGNWVSLGYTYPASGATPNAGVTFNTVVNTLVTTKWIRANVTTYTSGTINGAAFLRTAAAMAPHNVGIVSGSSTIGNTMLALPTSPSGTYGASTGATSAAGSNVVAKTSAAVLYGVNVVAGASAGFLMLFDATSAPADGAVTPKKCIPLAANEGQEISYRAAPTLFSTGLTAVFSTTGCFSKTASSTAFISVDYK